MSQHSHDHDHDHSPAGGVPVVILAGHDEAGKGDLLGRLVTGPKGPRSAIIRDAIQPGEESTTPHDRLVERLGRLGRAGRDAVIVYEAESAEPVLPAATAILDERLGGLVRLAGVVTVVDAARFREDYERDVTLVDDDGTPAATVPLAPILVEQIEAATLIAVHRPDVVDEATLREVEGYLVNLNPDATLIRLGAHGEDDGSDWLSGLALTDDDGTDAPLDAVEGDEIDGPEEDESDEVDAYGFNTFVYATEQPFAWDAFVATLEEWPDEVMRCRGYAVFADHPPALLSMVRDTCELTVLEDDAADAAEPDHGQHGHAHDPGGHDHGGHDHGLPGDEAVAGTELVFIGRGMPTDPIVARLDACLAPAGTNAQPTPPRHADERGWGRSPLPGRVLAHRGQDKDGDLAVGLLLVVGVVRVGGHGAVPPGGLLVAGDLAGGVVALDRAVLQLDVRVGREVVVPDGVPRGATERGDDGVLAAMLDPHQRALAQLAALRANRREQDDGHPAHLRALGAAGGLVALGLLAGPVGRTRFVLTGQWHCRTPCVLNRPDPDPDPEPTRRQLVDPVRPSRIVPWPRPVNGPAPHPRGCYSLSLNPVWEGTNPRRS